MTTNLDALIAEAREIDAVDLHEARNWAEDAESLFLSLADALESTLAELRQERERADEAERRWHASVKRANEIVDAKIELAEDLYRAEKTIEKVRSADGTTSSWADFGYQVLAILNEYDKQKEQA